jgi:hypothetical protein
MKGEFRVDAVGSPPDVDAETLTGAGFFPPYSGGAHRRSHCRDRESFTQPQGAREDRIESQYIDAAIDVLEG